MSKISKILIGAIAFVFVFVLSFVSVLFWMKLNTGDAAADKKLEAKKEKVTIHAIEDPIVANLSDNPNVYIRVSVTIESVTDKDLDAELAEDQSLATNVIITVLRHKTVAEVSASSAPDASMTIREEMVKELNKAYKTDKFVAVNFKEFIVQ